MTQGGVDGGERGGIDPVGMRGAALRQTLDKIGTAVVSGQDHDNAAGDGVEPREELAQGLIETVHLFAHLWPLRAIGVADAIGRRQADAEQIGRLPLAQVLGVDQVDGGLERLLVQFRRGIEVVTGWRNPGVQRPAVDFPTGFQRAALGLAIGPGLGRRGLAAPKLGVEGVDSGQTRRCALTRLDIGGQAEVVGEPVGAVGVVARQIDRAPVLAGHGEDARARALILEPVTQAGDADIVGADRAVVAVAAMGQRVAGRGQAIDFLTRRRVDPVVGRDAGLRGMNPGQDRGMSGAGLGQTVGLVAVGRDQAFVGQATQTARPATAILVEQVGAELIDHNGHDQLRRMGRR
ncbi:hypothetical protein D3C80_709400 [compost metagenome]